MYNNNYMIDNLIRQRDNINDMLKNYQAPMNVFNVANQIDFEARIITDENPNEIMVQRKTAFISFDKAMLTIKETNGDCKEYQIIMPKTKEQIENDELKEKIKDLEKQLNERRKL